MKSQRKYPSKRRGQAMVEYSMINWILILALVAMTTAPVLKGTAGGGGKNVIELFLGAYQTYYDSFYFLLNSPFP
jgi:hypothetical protein